MNDRYCIFGENSTLHGEGRKHHQNYARLKVHFYIASLSPFIFLFYHHRTAGVTLHNLWASTKGYKVKTTAPSVEAESKHHSAGGEHPTDRRRT